MRGRLSVITGAVVALFVLFPLGCLCLMPVWLQVPAAVALVASWAVWWVYLRRVWRSRGKTRRMR
jgi:hypothetical protein